MQLYGFELQSDVYKRMGGGRGASKDPTRKRRTRGLFKVSRTGQDRINRFLFPREGEERPAWQEPMLRALIKVAERGDRLLSPRT